MRMLLAKKCLLIYVSGYPSPQYKWLKDNKPITDISSDPFYKILSAKHEDEGIYRCIASNKIGSILSEEMKITVACKNLNVNTLFFLKLPYNRNSFL